MGNIKAQVTALFEQASHAKIGSAYAAAWGNLGGAEETVYFGKVSHQVGSQAVSQHTYFDLASLTKILATTPIFMQLDEAGVVDLHEPLKEFPHVPGVALADLLSHTSGLPAWRAYYEDLKSHFGANLPFVSIQQRKDFFYDQVLNTRPEATLREKVIYSDVGFNLLGFFLEKKFNKSIGELAHDYVWTKISANKPLTLHYRPVHCDAAGALSAQVAATEICPWRGWLQGQVHDDNAWSMGGVAAHAGVFGTLNDVLFFAKALMCGEIVSYRTLRKFFAEVSLAGGKPARRTLGFDMPNLDGTGTTGLAFGHSSVGHLGFCGTSLWVDLDTGDYACLLTNRVHPSRNDLRIRDLRINFHSLVRSGA